jgi:protein TonB
MFHYRLAPQNSRSRMLIAVLLAIALHIGFMNVEFEPKPILLPSVSLPRSVSVFLGQKNMGESPVQQPEKAQTSDQLPEKPLEAEREQEKTVSHKTTVIKEKTSIPLHAPSLLKETVKQITETAEEKSPSADEEIMPASQRQADSAEDAQSEAGEAAEVGEGVALPGTIQMAYPRYRLNDPPSYPGLARKRGQEGTVVLQVLVNRQGRVDDLKIDVSSNFALLDSAAVTAVRKWSFEPGRRGEERIPMWVRVPVTFKLK